MIQRVQSIFLFVVALLLVASLFFPYWQKVDISTSEVATMNAFVLTYEQFSADSEARELISRLDTFYISGLAIAGALVALFSIFQFKNRLRQIQLGALNSLLMAGLMITAVVFIMRAEKLLAENQQGTYLIGFYLPVGALLFNYLANRYIRRDEKLVRSADRLR